MTADAFREYIAGKFNVDLAEERLASLEALHRIGIPGPEECQHHHVPNSRTIPLDPRIPVTDREPSFWTAWYMSTLLHQAVHRYAPDQEETWLSHFGAHPLPMVSIGLGCWRVARPRCLLEKLRNDASTIPAACEYLRVEVHGRLMASSILPSELSVCLLSDRDFDGGIQIEALLAKSISQWQNKA